MVRTEKMVLAVAVGLMATFFAGLAYAYRAYGVQIPSCVTDVQPFTKGEVIRRGEKDYEIHVVARMWSFEPQNIVLPPGSRATIYLSSGDVVHGLQILGTNVNLMAVPGSVNVAQVRFEQPGEYLVLCHEYCGRGHQRMAQTIEIREPRPEELAVPTPAAAAEPPGMRELQNYSCLDCHTLDGSEGMGPTFQGLWGRTVELSDGTKLVVDEAYIIESIRQPEKKLPKGYDEPMPTTDGVSDEEIQQMLRALRQISAQSSGRPQ